jgi:hypothetical protein
MTKRVQPTIKQKLAFDNLLLAIESGQGLNWKEIMTKAGYSPASTINPGANLTETEGFKSLLAKIDDKVLLAKVYSIALDEDKRASLQAIDMLMTLKDRKPSTKYKVDGMDSEYNSLFLLNGTTQREGVSSEDTISTP